MFQGDFRVFSLNADNLTQILIGMATIVITYASVSNSRRMAKIRIYQSYLDAWHEINNTLVAEPSLRALIAEAHWPDERADQIMLEAFVHKYLDVLALSYRASRFGALTRKDFFADTEDIVRELGFMAPTANKFVNRSAFHPSVKRAFKNAFERLYNDTQKKP